MTGSSKLKMFSPEGTFWAESFDNVMDSKVIVLAQRTPVSVFHNETGFLLNACPESHPSVDDWVFLPELDHA